MSNPTYARLMARYNEWQNSSLMEAAAGLSSDDRRQDRGAFFGSIEATFAHLLWGDRVWMSRFAPLLVERPETRPGYGASVDWDAFVRERRELDTTILAWAGTLTDADFATPLTWHSALLSRTMTRPRPFVVTHFFNHQTHHRGQIHAMLTAAGARPDDTDLMLMEPE